MVVDLEAFGSAIRTFFEDPLGLVILSVGGGGLAANWLAGRWQLRALRYKVQLEAYTRFQEVYLEWFYALSAKQEVSPNRLLRAVVSLTSLRSVCRRSATVNAMTDLQVAMQDVTGEVFKNTNKNASDSIKDHSVSSAYEDVLRRVARELGVRNWLSDVRIRK